MKVGDKVKVNYNYRGYLKSLLGTEGIVTKTRNHPKYPIIVKFDDKMEDFSEDELDLISESEEDERPETIAEMLSANVEILDLFDLAMERKYGVENATQMRDMQEAFRKLIDLFKEDEELDRYIYQKAFGK